MRREAFSAPIACIFLSSSLAAAGPASEGSVLPAATILNAEGEVTVLRSGGGGVKAEIGLALREGDAISTGAQASASLLLLSGAIERVGPKSRFAIGPKIEPKKEASLLGGALRVLRLFGDPEEGQLGNVGGGVRRASPGFAIVRPRRSAVLSTAPVVRWTPHPGADRYRVRVASVDADLVDRTEKRHEAELTGALSLESGQLYFATVEALSSRGVVLARDETTFTAASDTTRTKLRESATALEAALPDDRFAMRVLLVELYLHHGFYAEALDVLLDLARARPDVEWARARIGKIAQLTDLPESALQKMQPAP